MGKFIKKGEYAHLRKVLIATGIYPPAIGGPATYSKMLADHLPLHGFSARVVDFGAFKRLPKVLRHFAYFGIVLIKGFNTDVIFAQDPVSVGLPAMLAAKIIRKKFVLKIVGDYAWEQGTQRFGVSDPLDDFVNKKYNWKVEFLRKVQNFVARRADKIIVPSEYLKKIVSTWVLDTQVGKIEVIYNSFEFPVLFSEKNEIRKDFGLEGKILISIGRLVPWKGFSTLIEIIPNLLREVPDLKLIIIGDGQEQEALKLKVKNLKLESKIILTGKLPREELLRYLKASDLFVLNTGYEGFSHQILEAMSVGTPIVTTKVGGNIEMIENNKDGILVAYNNKEELKKAISDLINNQELKNTLVKNAKEKVKQFSKEKMITETIKILS